MDDSLAKEIFLEIQARPYSLSLDAGAPCNNCFYKGKELLEKLGILGYTVRGRGGETYWDEALFGKEITDLLPSDFLITHFFVEIFQNNEWRIIDPSYQKSLEEYDLTIGSWENGKICFPLTKVYSQEEFISYQTEWFANDYQKDFFERGRPCWQALNAWFKERA